MSTYTDVLQRWPKEHHKDMTQNHSKLVEAAVALSTRYKGNQEVLAKISEISLAALNSQDIKRIIALKEWLVWLNLKLSVAGNDAPEQVKLPVLSLVEKIESEYKRAKKPGNSLDDLPKDFSGIDGRVTVEGHGNTFKVSGAARLKRTYGAQVSGSVNTSMLLASVQMSSADNTYEIDGGELIDQVGLQMNARGNVKGIVAAANNRTNPTKDVPAQHISNQVPASHSTLQSQPPPYSTPYPTADQASVSRPGKQRKRDAIAGMFSISLKKRDSE